MAYPLTDLPVEVLQIIIFFLPNLVALSNLAQVCKNAYDTLVSTIGRDIVKRYAENDVKTAQPPWKIIARLRCLRTKAPLVYCIHAKELIEIYAFEYLCGVHLSECQELLQQVIVERRYQMSTQFNVPSSPNQDPRSLLSIFETITPLMTMQVPNETWSSTLEQRIPNKCRGFVWRFFGPLGYDMRNIRGWLSAWDNHPLTMSSDHILSKVFASLFIRSRCNKWERLYIMEAYLRYLSLVEIPCRLLGEESPQFCFDFQVETLRGIEYTRHWELGLKRDIPSFIYAQAWYCDVVKSYNESWEKFDEQEYMTTSKVLRILDNESHRISVDCRAILDGVHQFWLDWKDKETMMSIHSVRISLFNFAWFVADRFAVDGLPEDAILISKQILEQESKHSLQDPALSKRKMIMARSKLAGYYIVAGRVSEALNEMQMIRSLLWEQLDKDNSLLPKQVKLFTLFTNTNLWFQNEWCIGKFEQQKKIFQAEFVKEEEDRQAAEVRLQDAGIPDPETIPLQKHPMYQMAEVQMKQQNGRVMMWELPWTSYPQCLFGAREEQRRWKWLRSRYRMGYDEQNRIDLLYEQYKERA